MNSVLESLQMAFPEVTVSISIIKKPKQIGGNEMTKTVEELHLEVDEASGDLLLVADGMDALTAQINRTNEKMQNIFSQPVENMQERLIAYSRELKVEMTNINNLMNYLNPQLQNVNKNLCYVTELANEIVNEKSPQTECNQLKA